ncbi:hypothetical protein IW262DRAFT_1301309 [Armillaria fumosa]|nr:hypothetical protein IW262DRAFT_1301309 [Armillaria fumosa]
MAKAPGSGSDSETGGVSITRDTTCTKLEALTFDDLWATPNKFLQPIYHASKNSTFGTHSSVNPWFTRAPDHYAVSCIPCTTSRCSACYMVQEMNIVLTCIVPFTKYNIGNLKWDLAQLRNVNHELEHLDYLLRSCYLSHDIIVCEIAEALDQLASHKGGIQVIEGLTSTYEEVNSFIINDGIHQSLGQPFEVPIGPSHTQETSRPTNQPNEEEDHQEGPSNSQEYGSDDGEFDSDPEA